SGKRKKELAGKGYLLVDLPGARVTFRPIAPVRRHLDLPPIRGAGLNAKELDAQIAERVAGAKIDDQIVRLLVWDVERATARDLDHAAIRGYKARALNFQLDLRRPEAQRAIYGNLAARGDKDSIRNLRAKARAAVRVELEFGLGSHAYRVERGLNNAELYQDGVVVANSLKEVTGRLQRVLGMTHDEFFNT